MPRPPALLALVAFPWLVGCVATPDPNTANIIREKQAAKEPSSMLRIGDAARSQGDLKTAVAFYGRACALQPHDFRYITPYAETLAQMGELGRAMTAIRNARLPGDGRQATRMATLLQARLLTTAQLSQDAIVLLNPEIARHPNDAGLRVARGVAFDTARDFPAAQNEYIQALSLEPGNLAARNNLALSHALSGAPREGLKSLVKLRSEAVEQGLPESTIAMIDGNLAIVYALLGEQSKARQAGAGAVQTDDQARANARFYSLLSPDVTDVSGRSGLPTKPD